MSYGSVSRNWNWWCKRSLRHNNVPSTFALCDSACGLYYVFSKGQISNLRSRVHAVGIYLWPEDLHYFENRRWHVQSICVMKGIGATLQRQRQLCDYHIRGVYVLILGLCFSDPHNRLELPLMTLMPAPEAGAES